MTTHSTATKDVLGELAMWVAERLDAGDDESAWIATRAMEHFAGDDSPDAQRPANPIIGHRFAVAHRRLLRHRTTPRPVLGWVPAHREALELQVCA